MLDFMKFECFCEHKRELCNIASCDWSVHMRFCSVRCCTSLPDQVKLVFNTPLTSKKKTKMMYTQLRLSFRIHYVHAYILYYILYRPRKLYGSVLLQLTSCLWPVCLGCSVSLPAGTGAAEPPPGSASVGSSSDAHSRATLGKRWHSKGCQSTNSGSILEP